MAVTSPVTRTSTTQVAAVAQGSTATTPVARAPFAGVVSSVAAILSAALTGANTNTRKLSLINKKQDGSGSTVVATLQFNSGTNAVAFDETALTLSGTAANLNVAAGDVLALESAAVGTGIADPGGLVAITINRA